ncbi:MAG: hypothetical protein SH856_07555 [Flavobacteriales bacterium]|nr:hypothetical protein [Flavobacteriales bacterium]
MKKSYVIGGFFALVFAGAFLASCLNEDNKIPPNCYDGILNNSEFLLDCGGPNCPECDHCINGIFEVEFGETCLDCGGECGECDPCNNCVMDGDEVGIDCGGTYCGPCLALCDDGILNGQEEEVDCGGVCEACPTCTDDMDNGDEIGIDCGGTECPPCATDGNCGNFVLDGQELWVDCGIGVTGFCESCDTIYNWTENNEAHTTPPAIINFTFDGTDLTVTGSSLEFGTMTIVINDPLAGWVEELDVPFDDTTTPDYVMTYVDAGGIVYTSALAPGEGEAFLVRFVPGPVGIMRLYFSGTLYSVGAESLDIESGVLMYPVD